MSEPEVPADVLEFLEACIDSVPQLEALLLLWEEPAQAWSPAELAARIYVEPPEAERILQLLERRGFVLPTPDVPGHRYHPGCGASARIAEVAAAYRQHVVRIATFIHARGSSAVRAFAEAFELKKES